MIDWIFDNLFWLIFGPAIIWFMIKELPNLIWRIKNTSKSMDDDPAGNDNIRRNFHDYM